MWAPMVTMPLHISFLHRLGYKLLQQHYSRSNHAGKLSKIPGAESPVELCRWEQVAEGDPRCAGKVLVSRALPWLLPVSPSSHTQQLNMKDFSDEGRLI